MLNVKKTLLDTEMFTDNEYLDFYCELIEANIGTKKQKFKTEKHHILPRAYFKILKLNDFSTFKKDCLVNKNNIVNLLYKDHILAHYYLCLCVNNFKLKQAMISAFIRMTFSNIHKLDKFELQDIQVLDKFQTLYENFCLQTSKRNLGRKLSDEHKQKISDGNKGKNKAPKSEEHKNALKLSRDFHATTLNKKSIYNKELNKVKFVFEEKLEYYLNDGWVIGGKPLSKEAKQKISDGNKKALKGKHHQPIAKDKVYSGLVGDAVMCVETSQIFENIKEAKKWLQKTIGITGGHIKDCCRNSNATCGKYHWKFVKGGD